MDCVMKSRISRWRSVRVPRVSSRTNVNEPMICLRPVALNKRMVRNGCTVSTNSAGTPGEWLLSPAAIAPFHAERSLLADLVQPDRADQRQRLGRGQPARGHVGDRHRLLADPV